MARTTRSEAFRARTGSKVHDPRPRRQRTRGDELRAELEDWAIDLEEESWDLHRVKIGA